ncbi:MAG: hypothetical protein JXB36_10890 [Gammaproteobacteria bacterium]|nr:hypothetical protein [Gammaproteobacteria bacterium]
MTERNSPTVDILRKVEKDLRQMPRHQWDSYLWDFCRHFVRLRDHSGAQATEAGAAGHGDLD